MIFERKKEKNETKHNKKKKNIYTTSDSLEIDRVWPLVGNNIDGSRMKAREIGGNTNLV